MAMDFATHRRGTNKIQRKCWDEISVVEKSKRLIARIGYNPEQLRINVTKLNQMKVYNNKTIVKFNIVKADDSTGVVKYQVGKLDEEINFLIHISLSLPISLEDILECFSEHQQAALKKLFKKYRLNDWTEKTEEIPPYLITLPKLEFSYVSMTAKAFNDGFGDSIIDPDIFPNSNIPRAFFYKFISCCIPRHFHHVDVIPQLLLVTVIINDMEDHDSLEMLTEIVVSCLESRQLVSLRDRIDNAKQLGLIVNNKWSMELLKNRKYSIQKIKELRKGENVEGIFKFYNVKI